MIDLSGQHMQIVREILKTHVPNCEVRVFGSRINGKSQRYSDLDLAVYREENVPESIISGLIEAFQESDLPFRVDVLDYRNISPQFRKIVDARNEVIQPKK